MSIYGGKNMILGVLGKGWGSWARGLEARRDVCKFEGQQKISITMVENNSFNVRLTAAFTANEIERSESKLKHSFHCVPWCCENCIREKTSHYGANVILFLTPSKEIEVREFQLMGITKQSRLHRCSRTVPSTCSPFYSVSLLDTRGPRGGHSPPEEWAVLLRQCPRQWIVHGGRSVTPGVQRGPWKVALVMRGRGTTTTVTLLHPALRSRCHPLIPLVQLLSNQQSPLGIRWLMLLLGVWEDYSFSYNGPTFC